ncbi:MAG: hypothetical protein RL095_4052 [Verrucomicrobiota bacterium]|jgi:LacI family transcriptional regulator
MAQAVNMAEVARLSGVSKAAVSVVLSGRDSKIKVSAATRERILAVVAELGYRANPLGRSLATQKSYLVALLGREAIFLQALETVKGIESVLRENDYSLLIYYDGSWAEDQARHLKLATDRRADGLIIVGAPEPADGPNHKRVAALLESGLPMVQLYSPMYPGVPTVRVDGTEVGYHATRQLIELGHKSIAHVTHDEYLDDIVPGKQADARRRYKGYERAMNEASLAPRVFTYPYGYPHDLAYINQAGKPIARQLLDAGMSAAFCYCDYVGICLLNNLERLGIPVPERFSVVAFDNIELAAITTPPLSTYGSPLQEIGSHAAKMLFEQMQGRKPDDIVLPAQFIRRDSIGPAHQG